MATSSEGISRRTMAVLFADVHGYTRLMALDEEGTYRRCASAFACLRALIGDYDGQVLRVVGDGVLAAFDDVDRAVEFALEVQREFRNAAVWSVAGETLCFRIGINTGEVIVTGDGEVYGHAVNVAKRLEELAPPGGLCVSDGVRQAVSNGQRERMRPLGARELKNVETPVEVYAVDLDNPLARVCGALYPPAPAEPIVIGEPGPSLAVLPFRNLSNDPRDQHLVDGFVAEVIHSLGRFRGLSIIARRSAFLFRDASLPQNAVARRLGVRYLLNGELRRVGRRLRVYVELVIAETSRVVWRERYDGGIGDIFAFEDDVTGRVTAALAVKIEEEERRRRSTSHHIPDLDAYGLVLRGDELSDSYRRDRVLHARRLFEHATRIDPVYSRSYVGMSRTFNLTWRYKWGKDSEGLLDRAVDLARKAVERDATDARAHAELGFAYLYSKQHDYSLASYERAVALNPNDADVLADMGDMLTEREDQVERGIDFIKRAIRLNPYHPDWYLWHLGGAYYTAKKYEEAIDALTRMGDQSEAHRLLAVCHASNGDMDAARRHAAEVLRVHPGFSIENWKRIMPTKSPETIEHFAEGLRLAGLK